MAGVEISEAQQQVLNDSAHYLTLQGLVSAADPDLAPPEGNYPTGAATAYGEIPVGDGTHLQVSTGPCANQFGSGYNNDQLAADALWSEIFPDEYEPLPEVNVKPPDMTEVYRKTTPQLIQKKATMFEWLSAALGAPTKANPWNEAKAGMLAKAGRDEAEGVGGPWPHGEDLRNFAKTYIPIVMGGRDPPEIRRWFPGFVPSGAYAGHKELLANGLKLRYMQFMEQFNIRKSWIAKERKLLRWYNKVQTSSKEQKENRTFEARDLEAYTKCSKRFCNWTACGVTKEFIPPPKNWIPIEGKPTGEYATQYHLPADPRNGKYLESFDHRDDGRGDEGRLERYKQAYKDHTTVAHTYDPKKAINIKPPTFKMKMTPEEFEDQKEGWKRFCLSYPDNTPELYYEMLQQSIDVELFKIIASDMRALNNRADDEAVTRIIKVIEKNAVIRVANEVYMTAFEKVRQEEGEMVEPYLSRLRSAAVRVELKKRGACTQEAHKTGEVPCPQSKIWTKWVADQELEDSDCYISDEAKMPGGEVCPTCCKDVEDRERKMWMIKKQFLNNLRNDAHKKSTLMQLQQSYTALKMKAKFDALKFNMGHIAAVATRIEEIHNASKQSHPNTPNANSGGSQTPKQRKQKKNGQPETKENKFQKDGKKKDGKVPRKNNPGITPEGKCVGCGESPHGAQKEGKPTNELADRKSKCKAWDKPCRKCKKNGHMQNMCRSKEQGAGGSADDKEPQPDAAGASTGGQSNWREPQWPNGPYMNPDAPGWENEYGGNADAAGSLLSVMNACTQSPEESDEAFYARRAAELCKPWVEKPKEKKEAKTLYPGLPEEDQSCRPEWTKEQKTRGRELTDEISMGCTALKRKCEKSWEETTYTKGEGTTYTKGNGHRGGAAGCN